METEEDVLKFWESQKAFQTSLELSKNATPFVFYDGPPFATGTPHYGHLVASTIKDIFGRYKTQTGYHVPRRWGWYVYLSCYILLLNLLFKNTNIH